MKITKQDLIGDIKDFPIEVVQKMVERQVEQGNKANVKVFQERVRAGSTGYGFEWSKTEEGRIFWEEVIGDKNFSLFFEKYPKQPVNQYPKVMEVSDNGEDWYKRVVFMEKKGYFFAWQNASTLEDAEDVLTIFKWKYARDIQQPLTVTKAEVAEKFGVSVDQLIIKD